MATTTLDRYRHITTLGTGGMATVVLAEDTVLGREVALKRMKTTGDERSLSRLRREALIGASVSHPNLVSIYDVVTLEDGDQVIVMEYVAGETLRDAVYREGRLAPVTALRVLEGVSAALDTIHRDGIVHRDVKPANILLGGGDTVKLADLGVASIPDRTRITTDGALVGTFSYMAPEQLSGSEVTSAADVYALAAVGFEALCGRKAHPESNPVALAHAISTQPPPDLREVWPEAPDAAAEVLIRGMSKDPEQRPRSASELTGRLRAALDPYTTAPQDAFPGPHGPRRPRPASGQDDRRGAGDLAAAAVGPAVAGSELAQAAERDRTPAERDRTPAGQALEVGTHAPSMPAPSGERRSDSGPEARPTTQEAERLRPAGGETGRGGPGRGGPPESTAASSAPPRRSRAGLIAAALIPLVVLAVALPLVLSSGGTKKSSPPSSTTGQSRSGAASAGASASSSSSSAGQTTTGAPSSSSGGSSASTAPSTGAGTPTAAVESFYTSAAAHRYSQAWALADPTFRSQLGGYSAFEAQQSGDRQITFDSTKVVSQSSTTATVAVQTTSVRDNGTQHCSGTVDLARTGSTATWLLHQIHINCT